VRELHEHRASFPRELYSAPQFSGLASRREPDVFVDGRRARAIEPKRSVFFFHLHDGETGIWVVHKCLETQMLERCDPAAVVAGWLRRKEPGRKSCEPVTSCFFDHDPTVRVLGCAGAFLFSFVVGDWGDRVYESVPATGQGLLEQVPAFTHPRIVEFFLDGETQLPDNFKPSISVVESPSTCRFASWASRSLDTGWESA
jgi:hypothetical protein